MKRLTALVLLAACGSADAPGPRTLPSNDVLCQLWQGTGPVKIPGAVQGWGSNADDVRGILGEPTERAGDTWTYEFTGGVLALTFEKADLCGRNDTKPIQPAQWVKDIDALGFDSRKCWILDLRNNVPTCDGCIEPYSVSECR
jgi:hypothetical protein